MSGTLEARFSDRFDIWGKPMSGEVDPVVMSVVCSEMTREFTISFFLERWGVRQTLEGYFLDNGILHATGAAVGDAVPNAVYLLSFSKGAPGLSWQRSQS